MVQFRTVAMKAERLVILLIVVLNLAVCWVFAQGKKEPPSRAIPLSGIRIKVSENQQQPNTLPKIELPEFVITGKEAIDLPVAYKSELSEEKIYIPNTSAKPNIGQRERETAELANPIKRSVKPEPAVRISDGIIKFGYGNFYTPFVDGRFGKQFSTGDISAYGNYKSSHGHIENADFVNGGLGAGGGYILPSETALLAPLFKGARLGGLLAFSIEKYRFYGVPNGRQPPEYPAKLFLQNQQRTKNYWGYDVSLTSDVNPYFDYALSFNGHYLIVDDVEKATESQFGFGLAVSKEVKRYRLKSNVEFYGNNINSSAPHNDPLYLRLGVGARRLLLPQFDLMMNVNYFIFRNFDSEALGKVYPQMEIKYYANEVLTFFGSFTPAVHRNSLYEMIRQNKYLANNVAIHHQDRFIDASFGLQVNLGKKFKAKVATNYFRVRDYPTYQDSARLRVWNVLYSGTSSILRFTAEGDYNITNEGRLSGTFTFRSSENSWTEKELPYLPNIEFGLFYQHLFPFGLTLNASMTYIGTRYIDLNNKEQLQPYLLMDFKGEYQILRYFGVFLYFRNLLNQTYYIWDNYSEIPFSVLGGISFRW